MVHGWHSAAACGLITESSQSLLDDSVELLIMFLSKLDPLTQLTLTSSLISASQSSLSLTTGQSQ